jgi:membrane peptidoglycan carboxypeptidase
VRPLARTTLDVIHQRSRRAQSRRRSPSRASGLAAAGLGALLVVVLLAAALFFVWLYAGVTNGLPSVAKLPALLDNGGAQFFTPTRFYDRTGTHLLLSLENPGIQGKTIAVDPRKAEHLPQCLLTTVQAVIDPGFWQHPGFQWTDLTSAKASTMAQQLADNLLLQDEPPSLQRNLRQRLLAAQITSTYGRDKVLEWYLNTAYFGHMAYGIEEAAQLYLGKPASQLDWSESALLAALIQAPALNPLDAPEAARQDQRQVLDVLLAAKQINTQQHALYVQEAPVFKAAAAKAENPAQAFVSLAMDQVANVVGHYRLERGGLEVRTTLDFDLQQQLVCTARVQLTRATGKEDNLAATNAACPAARLLPTLPPVNSADLPKDLSASGVILDPQTGQVLALLGDTNLAQGEAPVLQSHPSGTLLTPFIYLSAFTQGFGPASLVWDIPSDLPVDAAGQQNLDGQFHGPQRLRMALANDYLAPAVKMLAQVGPANVTSELNTFGLSQPDQANLPFEGGLLTPLQSAQLYAVFAYQGILAGQVQHGNALQPGLLLKVSDQQGTTWLDWNAPATRAIISTPLAYLVNQILSDEAARWPSLGYPNSLEIGRPAGAKLGLTQDGLNTWVSGYTPQRVGVVWVGSQPGTPSAIRLDPRLASGLWHALIQYTSRDLPNLGWNVPPGISTMDVCDPSGLLPTTSCPNVVNEIFLNGNEPSGYDNLFRKFQINRETGLLATVFTPPELVEEHIFMIVPAEAQQWAETTGLAVPPKQYDTIAVQPELPHVHISVPVLFSIVGGKVSVQGTASGDGLASFRLQVGQGLNPQEWLQVGSTGTAAVEEGVLADWDTSQQPDGLYALRLVVVRQDQQVSTSVIQVTVDNTPPTVQAAYPLEGAEIKQPELGTLILQAQASDIIGLQRVEFWLDGSLLGSLSAAPFSYPWQAAAGAHRLQIKVYDKAGNLGQSAEVKFTILK